MMLGLAILLFATAFAFTGWWEVSDPVGTRLARILPADVGNAPEETLLARCQAMLHRALAAVDPTFASAEDRLRALGVHQLHWIIAIEIAKLSGALAAFVLVAMFAPSLFEMTALRWIAPPVAGSLFLVLTNKAFQTAALNRRKRVRRELALGLEMLCIFLEGGQSLDQAFRSFSDTCADALPHIASAQRALVADLNNGVPYEKAIRNWSENLHVKEADVLVSLFVDSLVHGTELVPHLRALSLDMIEQRILNARASIGVKSSQLTVVMVAFFLPAILAFVAAPAVTAIMRTMAR